VGKVKGIGPVTAAKWLKTHSGNLKDVLANEIKNRKDRETIRLGYKLTKLNKSACEIPPIHKLKKRKGDPDELKRLLDKFEINKRRTL
jgi:5'-3' exonuclease